jgi:hypothetical protein
MIYFSKLHLASAILLAGSCYTFLLVRSSVGQERKRPALPLPEMQRLSKLYSGTWEYTETYPKSGAVNTGVYTSEPGPGGNSIFNRFHSKGPAGEFEGRHRHDLGPAGEGLQVIHLRQRISGYGPRNRAMGRRCPGVSLRVGRRFHQARVPQCDQAAGRRKTVERPIFQRQRRAGNSPGPRGSCKKIMSLVATN